MKNICKTLYLTSSDNDFLKKFFNRLRISKDVNAKAEAKVHKIIKSVREKGDKPLLNYVREFDNPGVKRLSELKVSQIEIKNAYTNVSRKQITSIKKAIIRIKNFSKKQLSKSWSYNDKGSILGEKVTPIESVGIYVPGGKASYPSTVLMNAVPAKVAGVTNVYMSCPINNIENHSLAIVAADLCKVNAIYKMGGAHAIAALAFGTKSIPKVDKIVGPGNIYVSIAKKIVFGDVGIDNIAGPSEVVIVADEFNNPDIVAMDLFSQAEHDELAQPILLSKSSYAIKSIKKSLDKLIDGMARKSIIKKSFLNRGMIVKTKNDLETANLINIIAPEHLEIMSKSSDKILKNVRNAGAIFLGENSPEVFGDYCAGPNHVLPTSGSARFSSPLGVYDFQKRSSLIKLSKSLAKELSVVAESIASAEGLEAHARSAKYRGKS